MSYPLSRPSFVRNAAPPPHVSELVSRYPDLSEAEMARLVAMFPRVRALDLSLMLADDDLLPRLEAFYARYRDRLEPRLADWAVIGAILSLPLMIVAAVLLAGGLS